MNYKIDFYTQYHQFYISDKDSPKRTEAEDFWTELATHARLATGESILGVGIECYGHLKGELILLKSKNEIISDAKYDHIVEGSINVKSGILQILDCPNTKVELEIKIKPDHYRVRIYSSNLKSVSGDSGDDFYKIEVWPEVSADRKVLKQYESNS